MSFDPVSFALGAASAKGGPGGASTLSGLTDVDITNPTDGQTLVYNAESGKWENGAGGGGIGLVMPNISITRTSATTGTATCDMTRAAIVSAIENGAICVARITGDTLEPGAYRFASDVVVYGATEEDEASVVFTTSEQLGDGDVEWCVIIVLDDSVDCNFFRTNSYNP